LNEYWIYNKISGIKLVSLYSTIKMMHGPINIRFLLYSEFTGAKSPVYKHEGKLPTQRQQSSEGGTAEQTVRTSCSWLISKEVNNYKGRQTKKFRDDCIFLQERSVDRTSSQDKWSKNKSYTVLRFFFRRGPVSNDWAINLVLYHNKSQRESSL